MTTPTVRKHGNNVLLTALDLLSDGAADGETLNLAWFNHLKGTTGDSLGDLGTYTAPGADGAFQYFVPNNIEVAPIRLDDLRPPQSWPWIRLDIVDEEFTPGVTAVGFTRHRIEVRTFTRNNRTLSTIIKTLVLTSAASGTATQSTLLAHATHRAVVFTLAAGIVEHSHDDNASDTNNVYNVLPGPGPVLDYMGDDTTHIRMISYLDVYQRTIDPRGVNVAPWA